MRPPAVLWRWPWVAWVALLCTVSTVMPPPASFDWGWPPVPRASVPSVAFALRWAPPPPTTPGPAPCRWGGLLGRRGTALASAVPKDIGAAARRRAARHRDRPPPASGDPTRSVRAALLDHVAVGIRMAGVAPAVIRQHLMAAADSQVWRRPDRDTDATTAALRNVSLALQPAIAVATPSGITDIVTGLTALCARDGALRAAMAQGGFGVARAVEARLWSVAGGLSPAEAAALLWELPKWKSVDPAVLLHIAEQLAHPDTLQALGAEAVARLVWGLAQARVSPTATLEAVADHVARPGVAAKFAPEHLWMVGGAYAVLQVRDAPLFERLAERAIGLEPQLTPRHWARLAWAFATVRVPHLPLMLRLATAMLRPGALLQFQARDLSMVLWAFATLQLRHAPLLEACGAHLQQPAVLLPFSIVDLATSAWAYARLRCADPSFFDALGAWAVQRGFATAAPRELLMVVWALASSGVRHEAALTALAQRCLAPVVLRRCEVRQLSVLLWGFATLQAAPAPLLEAYSLRASEKDFLSRGTPFEALVLAWGFATARWTSVDFLEAFKAWVSQRVASGGWEPGELARDAWALARLLPAGADASPIARLGRELLRRPGSLPQLRHQEVAALAWAYASRGLLDPDVLQPVAAYAATQPFLATAPPRSLATVAWAYAKLQQPAPWLFQVIADRVAAGDLAGQLTASDVAMLSWVCTLVGPTARPLMRFLAGEALALLPACSPGELLSVVWGLAGQHVRDPVLMTAIADKLLADNAVPSCSPWALSRLAWAYASLNVHARLLLAAVAEQVLADGALEQFGASHVAKLAWAYATLGIRYASLMDRLAERALRLQAEGAFTATELAMVVWAMEQAWTPE
eukprot:EG_transcript_2173